MNNTTTALYDPCVHPTPAPPNLPELLPNSLVYGLTFLVGVVGNVLVIVSICRFRRLYTVTNIFLVSLSSADLFIILLCVPIKFFAFFSYTWRFGQFLCSFVHYSQNVSMICSVTTLTVMSIERYYAILHPMRTIYSCSPARARKIICLIWWVAFAAATPIIFLRKHERIGECPHHYHYWCRKEYNPYHEIYLFVLIFLLPVTVMTYCYTRICRRLFIADAWRSATVQRYKSRDKKTVCSGSENTGIEDAHSVQIDMISMADDGEMCARHHDNGKCSEKISNDQNCSNCMTSTPPKADLLPKKKSESVKSKENDRNVAREDQNTRKQVIKMLVTIIVLFIICWGPILLNNLLVAFQIWPEYHKGVFKPLRQAFFLLAYVNSCVNPVVYGFMSKNFRQCFLEAICYCRNPQNRRGTLRR